MNARLLCLCAYIVLLILMAVAIFGGVGGNLAYALLGCAVLAGGAGIVALSRCADAGPQLLAEYVRNLRAHPGISTAAPAQSGAMAELQSEVLGLLDAWHVAELQAKTMQQQMDASLEDAKMALQQSNSRESEHQHMLENMRKISGKAGDVTQDLSTDVRKLSQLVADVDNGVGVQLYRLEETHEAMQVMVQSAAAVASNAHAASEGANVSREKAEVGAQEVSDAVTAIDTVKETVLALKEAMAVLGEKATNIGKVMAVINEVADQTNLLALNAAIEAARAGEAGRGFSVVADEVRKLAEKTMNATREVEEAVRSIQEETSRNVEAVEAAARHTVEGAQRASRAGVFMGEIVQRMEQTATQLSSIASATEEQSLTSRGTHEALEEIRGVASRTAEHMRTFMSALVKFSGSMEEVDMIIHAMDTGNLEAAASEQLITWTAKLELGIPVIDTQHRTLCNYINALHKAMKENKDKEKLRELLTSLTSYTSTHFSTEEEHFAHSRYPDTEKHKKVHKNFVSKLDEFKGRFAHDPSALSMDLLEFLKDWLIKHIMGTDTQYVSYVNEARRKQH